MKMINVYPARACTGPLRWLANVKILMPLLIYRGYETLDRAAELGCGITMHSLGNKSQFFDEYQINLPLPVSKWFPDLPADWTPNSVLEGRETEFFHVADSGVLPTEVMSRDEIVGWIEGELKSVRLKPARIKHLFSDPVSMIQLGYRLTRLAGRRKGLELGSGLVVASLCLVSLGKLGVPTHRCNKCFRWASPGLQRCRLHSLSKFAKSSHVYANARTVRQIRIAERALTGLNWPQDLQPSVNLKDTQMAVCSILWDLDQRDDLQWQAQLTHALKQAPTVKSLLPLDFLQLSSAAQLTALRDLIDENEWMLSKWSDKIVVAEKWFVAMQELSKTRTSGLSDANLRRLSTATLLINEGLPKKIVAERLDIKPSYLSQILKRGEK